MLFCIIGSIILILGIFIRKNLLKLNFNYEIQGVEDVNKWMGINIILAGIVIFIYGIISYLKRTALLTHIMLILIVILLFIRIFIGPNTKKGQQ